MLLSLKSTIILPKVKLTGYGTSFGKRLHAINYLLYLMRVLRHIAMNEITLWPYLRSKKAMKV